MTPETALEIHKRIAKLNLTKFYPSAPAIKRDVDPDEYVAIICSWLAERAYTTYDDSIGDYAAYCYDIAAKKHIDLNRFFSSRKRNHQRVYSDRMPDGRTNIDDPTGWTVRPDIENLPEVDQARHFVDNLKFDLRAALGAVLRGDRSTVTPADRRRLREHREAYPVDLSVLAEEMIFGR